MLQDNEHDNFEFFRDCISSLLIAKYAVDTTRKPQKRRNGKKNKKVASSVSIIEQESSNDAEDLADFAEYIATEIFTYLPADLRTLTYHIYKKSPTLQDRYSLPLTLSSTSTILSTQNPSTIDSLAAYSLLEPPATLPSLLRSVISDYLTHFTTPPPPPSSTKALATHCEICERDWIPLTYHHLIPREVHAKVLRRKWHEKESLNNVAWLCGQCHGFVHRIASTEELAREFYTVELLVEREDVRRWAAWVGKVRWKAR